MSLCSVASSSSLAFSLVRNFSSLSIAAATTSSSHSLSSKLNSPPCHITPQTQVRHFLMKRLKTRNEPYHNPPPRKPETGNKQFKYDFRVLEGKEYTHKPLLIPRLGGRDPETGKKVNQRVGGGIKWDWFWVRPFRPMPADGTPYEERVLEIKKDPLNTAFIALCAGIHGRVWRYATENMEVGQIIKSTNYVPKIPRDVKEGDTHILAALPDGTFINSVQLHPDDHKTCFVQNAGGFATVLRKMDNMVVIQLPNKHELCLRQQCQATVGRLSNKEHMHEQLGSPNEMRRRGIKQRSGQWHKKDGYQGRKIRPLPKMKVMDEIEIDNTEPYPATLSKRNCNGLFGFGRIDQMRHN